MNRPARTLPLNSTIVLNHLALALRRLAIQFAGVVAPRWTVRKAAEWFVTPPRFAHSAAELRTLEAGTRMDVPGTDGAIAAWRFGNVFDPLIVASHGWGGRGAQFGAWIAPLVRAGYQVVVFDHVAHGQSAGRHAPITAFAAGLAAVVRHLEQRGARVAGFVGHSLGCPAIAIALSGELRHLKDTRVVQLAPPASLIRYSRHFARHIGLTERLRAAMQWRIEQRIGAKWSGFELPTAVAAQRAQTLVIHDEHDRDVRFDSGLAVARAWPGARFKRTRGLGHRRIVRDASVVAAAIDFLRDRVEFAPAPRAGEWTPAFASLSGIAPLY